jgi:hypothetical protein
MVATRALVHMRRIPTFVAALLVAVGMVVSPTGARPVAAADQQIRIASYDVAQTPMSGYGCWTHTYTGTIAITSRTLSGSVACGENSDHLANYSGGSGTLNDGVVSTTNENNQLFVTADAGDGSAVAPVITLHLAQPAYVNRIKVYGGDIPWNALPGALSAATIQIGDYASRFASTPFGEPNAVGVPANDLFDLEWTEQMCWPTDTIVLRDFESDWFGTPGTQFPISEIVVEGTPVIGAQIAVMSDSNTKSGDPVLASGSRGKISVVIFGTSTFDVRDVTFAWGSPTFGIHGYENSLSDCAQPTDVNRDGRLDLTCHFVRYAIDLTVPGTYSMKLNGDTVAGGRFHGEDTVIVKR